MGVLLEMKSYSGFTVAFSRDFVEAVGRTSAGCAPWYCLSENVMHLSALFPMPHETPPTQTNHPLPSPLWPKVDLVEAAGRKRTLGECVAMMEGGAYTVWFPGKNSNGLELTWYSEKKDIPRRLRGEVLDVAKVNRDLRAYLLNALNWDGVIPGPKRVEVKWTETFSVKNQAFVNGFSTPKDFRVILSQCGKGVYELLEMLRPGMAFAGYYPSLAAAKAAADKIANGEKPTLYRLTPEEE